MSVEAPALPSSPETPSPETALLADRTTEELWAEIYRRRELEEPPRERWSTAEDLESSSFPPGLSDIENTELEETDSEDVKRPSYFGEDDPEKAADDRNRAIDHEILGRTVRVKQDINAKAHEAVSRVDRLFAQAKNLVGKPREVLRKWHMDRADRSLEKKEARFEKKKQEWEEKLEATGSGRLRERRQAKAEKVIQKEQGKVEDYKTRHVEHRQKKYQETVELREGRIERSSARQGEREASVAEARQQAIENRAVALGRKELRARLRGSENNAGLLETRRVMNEILGEENAEEQLRQLGHLVIERQLSTGKLSRNQMEQRSAEQMVERLTTAIAKEQKLQEAKRAKIQKARNDYAKIMSARDGEIDINTALPNLELFTGAGLEIFTPKGAHIVARAIESEEKALENSVQNVIEMESQLKSAEMKIADRKIRLQPTEYEASQRSVDVDDYARDILN